MPAAVGNANLNIQVHGGIGFTWEHDAHLYLRRAAAIAAVADVEQAAIEVTDLVRGGVRRAAAIELPPEAEPIRAAIRPDVARLRDLDGDARKQALIESGYAMPHWPKPWGRDATAIEQLVIEQEFAAAGIKRPGYGITSWIILTLIQHASPDQVARWVRPALNQDVIWCQLFSEPGAGSDAAGIRTRATRTGRGMGRRGAGGSTARRSGPAARTLAELRPGHRADQPGRAQAPGHHHDGDRHARARRHRPAAEDADRGLRFQRGLLRRRVRPRRPTWSGPVDGGWTVARATLGNESVSIGGGDGGMSMPVERVHRPARRAPGAAGRRGRAGRPAHRPHPGDGRAEPAQRLPGGGRRRPRAGGQHHQAAAVRDRPRDGRDHGRAGRAGRGVPRGPAARWPPCWC